MKMILYFLVSFIESMTKKNKSQSFIIRNNSVNGDTTRKALERINYDVFGLAKVLR